MGEKHGYEAATPWPAIVGLGSGLLIVGVLLVLKGSALLGIIPLVAFLALLVIAVYRDLIKAARVGMPAWTESELPFKGITGPKLGMWLFLGGEIVFFAALIGYSLALRLRSPAWPVAAEVLNLPLAAINTFILITSSMTMAQALASIGRGNQAGLRTYLLLTVALGLTFLGIKFSEYASLLHEGIAPGSSLFALTFYAQTGAHAAHVAGGVVGFSYVIAKAFQGLYSTEAHNDVELVGLYWHFVDIVWILLFVLIYLI